VVAIARYYFYSGTAAVTTRLNLTKSGSDSDAINEVVVAHLWLEQWFPNISYLHTPKCCIWWRIRDGHVTNIINKQAWKDGQCTLLDRCGFKICEKLTHCAGVEDICGTIWLFLKSTHLVHPITVVHPWKFLVHPGMYNTPSWQALD